MKQLLTAIFLYFLVTSSVLGQLYKHHDWAETPTYTELSVEDTKLHSVAIKEKYLIQYHAGILGNTIRLFETKHSIIRINTDKGIEKHNKVYIPTTNVKKVIDIKARVLQKDGTIKNLDKKNIKELKNVKNYGNFKIFAIEGVTVNSQLEFIYTLERYPSRLGYLVVQKNYKVQKAEIIIRKPSSYEYRLKALNGFPDMQLKKVEGNKQALTATIKNIEAMTDEGASSAEANRMKVSYQVNHSFSYNTPMWTSLATNIRNSYLLIKPKRQKALIKHYTKFIEGKPRETNTNIINNICEYVYGNYNVKRRGDYNLSDLKYIFAKKQANEQGMIKLFSCLFNHENIDYELVLTSNRYYHKFDEDFYSTSNLQIALFYFDKEQKYLRPNYFNDRLHFAPTNTITNKGIFIDKNGSAFKKIKTPKSTENVVKRNFSISINTDDVLPTVTCNHILTGYRAKGSRGAYKYYKKNDLNKYKGFTAASGIEDVEFSSFDVKNEDISLSSNNTPFKLNYTYTSESLIEDLGDDFLLNFGKVIGTQSEFYQEAKRVNPVELGSLITYSYEIKIKIPDGYEAKNIDDAAINKVINIDDKLACSFVSSAKISAGFIIINATEIYDKIHMKLEHYNGYRDVVNSAFDFSKKSILFKKL